MNGIELSRSYYETYGLPMLQEKFPRLLPYLAAGFVGSGSEHYGFDDEISRDHDFEPGFCIFLPDEETVSRRDAFLLERAYAALPKEYMGLYRSAVAPVGGRRNGVLRTADFYRNAVGSPDGKLTQEQWLTVPDYALAEATNGQVFYDGAGAFTAIREGLMHMPRDIRLKRLAGNLLLMGQAGQYNFARCLLHGETEAAQLAVTEFVQAALKTAFLLAGQYMPYYKWSFRALRLLPGGWILAEQLGALLRGDNGHRETVRQKTELIEAVRKGLVPKLEPLGVRLADPGELEQCAYAVNNAIGDETIRNLHILAAI